MLHTVDIVLPLEVSEDLEARRNAAARTLGVSPDRVRGLRLRVRRQFATCGSSTLNRGSNNEISMTCPWPVASA